MIARDSLDYGTEAIILRVGDQEVRCPAYPEPCSFVRIVKLAAGREREVLYWTSQEWAEAPDDVVGAILGAIKQVADGREIPE